MDRKYIIIIAAVVGVLLIGGLLWYFLRDTLENQIVIPYITHQQPQIDPHLPHSVALSDKLDEVLFDGLFNISANPSGIVYEDALGELIDVNSANEVIVRLNGKQKWHSSFTVAVDDDKVSVSDAQDVYFTAQDLRFTLNRIRQLGSMSPDYILVSQALKSWDFSGPDNNNEIRLRFKDDREWVESDVKEVLSFKIIPQNSELAARSYHIGSGPYLAVTPQATTTSFFKNPAKNATIENVLLQPFVDNSTYTTELKNGNINVLLDTPFGSQSPILENQEDYFYKSNISNTFFTVIFNTQRLNLEQRKELRKLINNRTLIERFYKVNTPQQRHIYDYLDRRDNYGDYLNNSAFPASSYYVEGELPIVDVIPDEGTANIAILPDSIKLVACRDFGLREEYGELLEIFQDRSLFGGRIRAVEVNNNDIKSGNYDAVLLAINGYKSTALFNLYDIFLREPDLEVYSINLVTDTNRSGSLFATEQSLRGNNNFARLDAAQAGPDQMEVQRFLQFVYGFMSANNLGDRHEYARLVNESEQKLALGKWLFSMPSLAYFRTQFDNQSIDLYGVASQLSTIEKWRERQD